MIAWKSTWNRLPVLLNYFLVFAAIGLTALFFPDKLRFRYEYETGRTWPYENLYAPFDFAIPKDQSIYDGEVDSLLERLAPLYRRVDSVEATQMALLTEKFNEQLQALEKGQFSDLRKRPQVYLSFAREYLQSVFNRGVIEWAGKKPAVEVSIVRGKASRMRKVEELADLNLVLTQVYDTLRFSGLPNAEFLFPILTEVLRPNLYFDEALNEQVRKETVGSVPRFRGMVQKGSLIIQRGEVVSPEVYQELEGYRLQYEQSLLEKRSGTWLFAGYLILTLVVYGLLLAYLWFAFPFVLRQFNQLLLLLLWPVLFAYCIAVIQGSSNLSPYLLPFAIVPIVIKNFYDNRLALFVHLVVVLLIGFLSSLGFTFIFLQLVVGVVVVISRQDTHTWSGFFYLVALLFLTSALVFFGLEMTEKGSLEALDWSIFTWLALNNFLVLLAYPITSLLERLLGLVSVLRLKELADTNRPLLQLLAHKAPGTFQHALQVANLSEAAARKIGADYLLVKVGALYHDIGKTLHPEYFIENQSGKNLHEALPFEESARFIIGHVTEGAALARKYGLPRVVVDFILTHHGTTRVEYFFRKLQQQDTSAAEEYEHLFRYPGPLPMTREATILMMADGIEAACRSLKNPGLQSIHEMVERIIQRLSAHRQFSESSLSFAEMEVCKQVFKDMLCSVYHLRVEYPELPQEP